MAITTTLEQRSKLHPDPKFVDRVRVAMEYEAWYQRSTSSDAGTKTLCWKILLDPAAYAPLFAELILTQENVANTAPLGTGLSDSTIASAVGGVLPQLIQP